MTQRKQELRLRRLWLAVAVYAPCTLLLYAIGRLGHLPAWLPPAWGLIFVCTNLAFFGLIKSDLNLRFADPSMTMAQMAVGIGAAAMVLYHAGPARGAILMFLPVIVVFGVLHLRTRQLLLMGAFAAAAYGAVVALLAVNRPGQVDLRLEGVQWLTLTATLAVLCPLIGYMSDVRRRLSEALRTIRDAAQRDPLTGLFNRRHLAETLDREIGRCERGAAPILLVMLDIDHFKRVNDTRGHQAGDEVLREVAACMGGALRKGDYLARYGGEEFSLIVSAQDGDEARATCDRLRQHIETLHDPDHPERAVTASIGASFYRPGDTRESLVERADAALYRAKSAGRNRTELDGAGPGAG